MKFNTCSALFLYHLQRIQRNIGVVIKATSVHVFMGGPTDPPYFQVRSGYSLHNNNQFNTEALSAITEGLGKGFHAFSDQKAGLYLSKSRMYCCSLLSRFTFYTIFFVIFLILDLISTEMGKKASTCSRFPQLTTGQMYPTDATSAENTVGGMDIPINRADSDFTK